ncbi:TPA: restriction endonuclease subunit S [Vibrio cholerae]|uniref:restriction endonuclease subunit S n=1 Tax=Vibrio cholerae TaxID=666 RepID=UPI001B8282B3|nr:restriction endonuclease subunit S [Vibrio cholerae]
MSFDWPEVRLGDYIDSCLGKMLDKKKNKGTLQPYLGNSNVRWGNFDLNDLAQMKFEDSEHERYSLESGDLVVCEGGEPGRCAIWEGEVEGMKIQKALHRVRPNQYLNNYYLYYWFLYAGKTGSLEPYFTGTTIKHLTGRALANLPIRIPPLDIQLQCVSVLYSLDKKISHNIKTNQTLEEMAQAIFKSWFVDFDPVKAKMNGDQPEGMDAATASLFPEKLVSETGLPEGWKLSEIGDEVTVVGGGTPSKKNDDFWIDGHIHWTSPKDLSGVQDKVLLDTASKVTEAGLKKISSGLLPVDTVLLSSRAPVGYLALAKVPMAINQGYIAMKCEKQLPPEFVLQWCVHRMDEIKQRASGSTFAEISKKSFKPISVVVPTSEVLSAYQKLVKPLYDAITSNARQNEQLSILRDTLLPKLLSGDVKLSDPKVKVGEIG